MGQDNASLWKSTALIRCGVFLHLFLVWACPAHSESPPAASPAQLQTLTNQIAGLQAQQQAKWAELGKANAEIADIESKIAQLDAAAKLPGMARDAAIAAYLSTQGLDPSNAAIAGAYFTVVEKTNLEAKLKAAIARRDAIANQISDLDKQIAQAQATLTYWQNPAGKDLENELTHMRNLENQTPTKDDAGQRQWDIENTYRRIKELEQQFQQSTPGGTSGSGGASSGQPSQAQNPSYTAPAGYGTGGAAGQSPPTSGGYWGTPPSAGAPPVQVPWQGLVPPSSGGGGGTPGSSSGGSGGC